jgi:site-specific DNA-methyltransferase (adenine-specific)
MRAIGREGVNIVLNCDCIAFMRAQKDCIRLSGKRWEFKDVLAIVDPEYGDLLNLKGGTFTHFRTATKGKRELQKIIKPSNGYWNKNIDKKYFKELFRVSRNQIICGGNYFELPPTRDFVVFEKCGVGDLSKLGRSQCEYIWTSFAGLSKIFKWVCNSGKLKNYKKYEKIHPCQKPVALYKWLLKNYACPGQLIFDSHAGSGSSRIACQQMGFDFIGCEIDQNYWKEQEARYKDHVANADLFAPQEIQALVYEQKEISCFSE